MFDARIFSLPLKQCILFAAYNGKFELEVPEEDEAPPVEEIVSRSATVIHEGLNLVDIRLVSQELRNELRFERRSTKDKHIGSNETLLAIWESARRSRRLITHKLWRHFQSEADSALALTLTQIGLEL